MTPIYIAVTVVCAVVAAGLVIWFVLFSNNSLTVSRYNVKMPSAPESPVHIVHLSDIHGKSFGKGNARLLAKVKALCPDLIAYTGDIIHVYDKKDIKRALALVKELSAIAPVLYVSGNHEMRGKKYRAFAAQLEDAGAIVLDDRFIAVKGITVAGLNASHLRNNKIYQITPRGGSFKLLLAHEPQFLIKYARAGYDLALCGHAHGGQWRLPFAKKGLYAPGQGIFPEYTSGRHICGATQMIVSRGLGNSEFPLRLFNRPEIVIITVERGGNSERSKM